jgi:protein-S-isoprenylcysteine O-methyltransferase Ste14
MKHSDHIRRQGNWLFRWRSFLPLLIIPLFIIGLRNFTYPKGSLLLDRLWELFCFAIALFGLGIRIYTVGYVPERTSGRTTSEPKAQGLNTTGMYSIVRHPLYLANFVIWVGIVLSARSVLLTATCILAYFPYYERIIAAEEGFLSQKFGEAFYQWAEKTPMVIPKFKLWCKSTQPFSWQVILTREYPGFFVIIASLTAIELLSYRFYKGNWQLDWVWVVIFCVGLLVFVTLRTLKKLQIIGHP